MVDSDNAVAEASQALTLAVVQSLAIDTFAVGADAPMAEVGTPVKVTIATVMVAVLVKQAIVAVWKDAANKICHSPERPDLKMSQEEAQGWLVGALFERELLLPEARNVGKRVDNYAAAEDKAAKKAKETAKGKKKEARKAATQELVQDKLARIEAGLEAKREERLAREIDLDLPPVRSTIVESGVLRSRRPRRCRRSSRRSCRRPRPSWTRPRACTSRRCTLPSARRVRSAGSRRRPASVA